MSDKKPWLCRLGLHRRTYVDSAMVLHAFRCGICHEFMDEEAGRRLTEFRGFVETLPKDDPDLATPLGMFLIYGRFLSQDEG